MSPRLRRCIFASIPYLAVLVVGGWLTIPAADRAGWFLTFIPLAAALSIGMDYFVWRTPEREGRLEVRREARRPNIRL